MKTNYALVALVPTDDPNKGGVIHTCWYENPPKQNDVESLIEELRTDEEFGMTDMVIDRDYFLHELTPIQVKEIKEDLGIPDDLDESTDPVKAMVITKENFETEVKQSSVPVLIDVWATWCGPCKRMLPIVDELATKAEGKFKVGKIDAEVEQELSQQLNVRSIPAFFVFKDGEVVNNAVGMHTEAELLKLIGLDNG